MKTLFLAWQDGQSAAGQRAATRAWFPIGRLDAEPAQHLYRFAYTRGALNAREKAGFQPLDAFPRFEQVYESAELFSLFRNRLISEKREDYPAYVARLDLPMTADPFEILAISGGTRQTDNLEVFPKIQKRRDGSFACRFFLHGWRHVNAFSQERLTKLQPGDQLQVSLELNNPATGAAIQLETANDYFMVGWAPRYLVGDMLDAMAKAPDVLTAQVVRINPPPAPHNQRVLVQLQGRFNEEFEPMSTEEFRSVVE